MGLMINFTYLNQPPRKFTFEQPKLKLWTESWCKGKVLNLFAGKTLLNVDELRIDMNIDMNCDIVMDAFDFVNTYKGEPFDTVVYDPPYNYRKSMEKYKGKTVSSHKKIKDILSRIIRPGGRIISFGYDSVGMSKSRGFKKIAICLVCHNGAHNDTICLVESKIGKNLKYFFEGE